MSDEIELEYEGPPALVGALAQMLREEGLEVSYEPPMESRAAGVVELVVVGLIVKVAVGTADVLVTKVVERFHARWPQAKVQGKHVKP